MKRTNKTNIKMLYSFLAILIICSMLFTGAPIALATGVYPNTNEDGDITKNIKTSDDINVNEAGTYHINYSVTDSHGNTSTLEVPVTVEKDGTIFENGALTAAAKENGTAVMFDSDVDRTTPGTYHVSVTFTIDKADPEVIPSGAFVVDNDNDHSNAGNTGDKFRRTSVR